MWYYMVDMAHGRYNIILYGRYMVNMAYGRNGIRQISYNTLWKRSKCVKNMFCGRYHRILFLRTRSWIHDRYFYTFSSQYFLFLRTRAEFLYIATSRVHAPPHSFFKATKGEIVCNHRAIMTVMMMCWCHACDTYEHQLMSCISISIWLSYMCEEIQRYCSNKQPKKDKRSKQQHKQQAGLSEARIGTRLSSQPFSHSRRNLFNTYDSCQQRCDGMVGYFSFSSFLFVLKMRYHSQLCDP